MNIVYSRNQSIEAAPLQFSLPPKDGYGKFLEDFAKAVATPQKIHSFYDVVLPGLVVRYRAYLDSTDRLLDEPTVRVMESILGDFSRMRRESAALRDEVTELRLAQNDWAAELTKREAAEVDIVEHRSAAATAA